MFFRSQRSLLFLLILVITGCSSIGPKKISMDRGSYNDIVRETDQEQLLKNIVRLRYMETPSYMQVTNVTASYTQSSSMTATNVSTSSSNAINAPTNWSWASLGFTPNLTYSDSPTISYVPVTDPVFITSLQTPIDFSDFILLSRGALYDPQLMLMMLLERVGNLNNNSTITSTTIHDAPDYEKYYRFTVLLKKMVNDKTISVKPVAFNQEFGMMLYFNGNSRSADALALKKMLQVSPSSQHIIFMQEEDYANLQYQNGALVPQNTDSSKPSNTVYVQLRSINAVMSFLSHGVQVPEQDLKSHITMEIIGPNGQIYDWDPMMRGIMTIYSSDKEPTDDVLIKTFVNHHWFYIKASDLDSKMTFSLLVRLITLTSVSPPTPTGPALTLPVG